MATTFLVPVNNAYSTLASDITDVATSLAVATGEGVRFGSVYPFHITIESEILECTNRSTDTLTVTRHAEGTSAAAHVAGKAVNLYITKQAISDLNTAVNAIENAEGAASGIATLSAGSKVNQQPASISDFLDDTTGGTDALTTKAATSNVTYDHGVATTGVHGVGVGTIAKTSDIPSFATPAIVLGTAAAAGSATTVIKSDGTIAAFDATVPVTQAFGDSAATGSIAYAARRDHKHGMPSGATPDFQRFTSSGTWTKPTGVTHVIVEVIGGGGGGGGGIVSTSGRGGGGGGGGALTRRVFAAASLGGTETVTIGAKGTAGTGGASPTAGGVGGTSSFGTTAATQTLGYGGGGGAPGATANTGGGGGGGTAGAGGVGGAAAGVAGLPRYTGTTTTADALAGGGAAGSLNADGGNAECGGGGGASSAVAGGKAGGSSLYGGAGGGGAGSVTPTAGGAGGSNNSYTAGSGGTGGTSPSGNGGAGADGTYEYCGKGGGGGGGGGAGANGGTGGAGGAPGGGGGGGGPSNNATAGNGGLGGLGEVRVWSW